MGILPFNGIENFGKKSYADVAGRKDGLRTYFLRKSQINVTYNVVHIANKHNSTKKNLTTLIVNFQF